MAFCGAMRLQQSVTEDTPRAGSVYCTAGGWRWVGSGLRSPCPSQLLMRAAPPPQHHWPWGSVGSVCMQTGWPRYSKCIELASVSPLYTWPVCSHQLRFKGRSKPITIVAFATNPGNPASSLLFDISEPLVVLSVQWLSVECRLEHFHSDWITPSMNEAYNWISPSLPSLPQALE